MVLKFTYSRKSSLENSSIAASSVSLSGGVLNLKNRLVESGQKLREHLNENSSKVQPLKRDRRPLSDATNVMASTPANTKKTQDPAENTLSLMKKLNVEPQIIEIPSVTSSPVIVMNDELYIRRTPSDGSPQLIPHSSKKSQRKFQITTNICTRPSATPTKKRPLHNSMKKQGKKQTKPKERPSCASSKYVDISFVIHPEDLGGRIWARRC